MAREPRRRAEVNSLRRSERGGGEWRSTLNRSRTPISSTHDHFVVLWNGDMRVKLFTDYEGHTKTANVFASSIEAVWRGETRKNRLRDMIEGRLLDVCARCMGVK